MNTRLTLEEAVQWCDDHAVSVSFDFPILIHEAPLSGALLGSGATLIEAVQAAMDTYCVPLKCRSLPDWMCKELEWR